MWNDLTGLVYVIAQHLPDFPIGYEFNVTSSSPNQPGGGKGLSLTYKFSFFVICLLGIIAILESIREALNPIRKAYSKILLYVGSTLLSYELFLFVNVTLFH